MSMNRRDLLKLAGAAAAPAVGRRSTPNILFINADQLNAGALSGHGCGTWPRPISTG